MSKCACGSTDYDPNQGCCFEPRCCTCNDALAIRGDDGEYEDCPDCAGGKKG